MISQVRDTPASGLSNPREWSHEFNDFVQLCLTLDPDKRPTAAELLNHPFMQKSRGPALISELVNNPDTIASIEEQWKNRVADHSEEVGDTYEIYDKGDTVINKNGTIQKVEAEPFFMQHIKKHGIDGCKEQQEEYKKFINEDDKEKLMYKR